ncbi:TetR/AcrR family transcriptional regulator [Mycolicibacterium smegmatis]|nr:TetR/AcrR family transcriptional regulator C-terminal domain-containing protein [Mycolicibacterium smegmatis]ABK72344.1 putative transcriptional regulator [Mycolicibacterium smegmatis MC2 155]AIU07762.1 transcriptional regulator [Mycolicibacterium smegmatis MC2 155]AIU14387.1 transcriptional regulator [Mycolicibacterium smegmatis]AIU21010.1 transcriptional regulator [Mycolicibacterium smegmatis]MBE9620346.1 TetR/AcrR family transcriptional regulator C-terminal domain-containing protein [Myc
MPRQRSLTRPQIAAAALEVVDTDGLGSLSMRTVARRLGMGTMSLYRYVADRDELEAMVVELVLESVDLRPPAGSARHRILVLAERVRDATARHPAVVPLLLAHRHRLPASLRWGEAVLGVLAEAGYAGKRRVYAFRALLACTFGALEIQHHSALSGPGTRALAELPADEFPRLSETAAAARGIGAGDEFRHGLEILLRGLQI